MSKSELEIMLAFKELGTITEAAKKVGLSRSSASRKLKKIQEDLNADLFFSTLEGISPTYAGEIYLKAAKDILDIYNEMISKIT